MTTEEMLAILIGGGVGYILVTWVLNRSSSKAHHVWKGEAAAGDAGRDDSDFRQTRQEEEATGRHDSEADYIQKSWHLILDVPADADRTTVVAAYRRKIRQYHPDRVATLGDELRELAEFKSKQINAAYDYAMSILPAD